VHLEWAESSVDLPVEVVAFASAGESVWAVARREASGWRRISAELNARISGVSQGSVSEILCRKDGRWSSSFNVRGTLNAICSIGDGSVVAVGDHLAVHYNGGGWDVFHPPALLSHAWGAESGCVYALGQRMLFYFNGKSWTQIDLLALGIEGDWADGSCDSSGKSWTVGTWGSHSCMATGLRTEWKTHGCGSWYLYKVAVSEAGLAFAAGGDGLWRLVNNEWNVVEAYGRDTSRVPLALLASGASPVVVAARWPWRLPEHSRQIQPGAELDAFVSSRWETLSIPVERTSLSPPPPLALRPPGRLLVAEGQTVWESSPLVGRAGDG